MAYTNETDVTNQMQAWGLDLERKPLVVGRLERVKVQGRKGKKGWYHLHEFPVEDKGDPSLKAVLLTGAFGHFEGADSHYAKVALSKDDLPKISPGQQAENRKKAAEAKKRADGELAKRQQTAALQAQRVWQQCNRSGQPDYLAKKLIRGHDVRYTPSNAVVIPLQDTAGNISGLQFILDKTAHKDKIAKRDGNNKELWPPGLAMKGRFFQIGPMVTTVCLVCEGYATGASLYEATGLPVVIAFNAGNLELVLRGLLPYHKEANYLICADDDDLYGCQNCHAKIQLSRIDDHCPHCGLPHKRKNAGVEAAMKACFDPCIRWIRPKFDDNEARVTSFAKNQGKLTDYNDLHGHASLSVVRRQIESAVRGFSWGLGGAARVVQPGGAGEKTLSLYRVESGAEAIERYSLVYAQKGTVFDHECQIMMAKDDMRDVCSRDTMDKWQHSPHRRTYAIEQVGFDPTGLDETIKCNLWKGWPTEAQAGDCSAILELLQHLCSGEGNSEELYQWALKWFAHPIQNPGAKIASALVIHGGQGCGKNLLAEAVMGCYGDFGKVIDQDCLEDKHNDFFSKKLYLIADEVIGRSDRYHVVNKLKGLITDTKIRINPKNIAVTTKRTTSTSCSWPTASSPSSSKRTTAATASSTCRKKRTRHSTSR